MGTSRLLTRGPARSPRHSLLTLAVVLAASVAATSCGTSKASGTTTTAAPAATATTAPGPTTTAPRVPAATVEPATGGRNTVFTLTGTNLPPGMTVKFDIIYPGGSKTFSGQQREVPPDGTLQVTYRASASNPVGEYTVRIIGTEGKIVETKFRVAPGQVTTPGQVPGAGGGGGGGGGGGTGTTKPRATGTTAKAQPTTIKKG